MREGAGNLPDGDRGGSSPAPASTADRERVLLLECRLEQLRSSLDEARAEADRARGRLAEAAAREADHARRYSLVHQELAEARAELAALQERLGRSEALRAELEGHLFEAGAHGDAAELVRMRREVIAQRERSVNAERTLARVRSRMNELLLSRETLLTRIAEWQRMVRREDPDAIDLAEFISELRRDILHLEQRNAAGERQEAVLRERLLRAGLDPDGPLSGDPEPVRDDPVRDDEGAAEPSPAIRRPRDTRAEQEEGDDEADLATRLNGVAVGIEEVDQAESGDLPQDAPASVRRSPPEEARAPSETRGAHEGPEADAAREADPATEAALTRNADPGPETDLATATEREDSTVPAAAEAEDPTVPPAAEAEDPTLEPSAATALPSGSEDAPGAGAEAGPSEPAEAPNVAAEAEPQEVSAEAEAPQETAAAEPPEVAAQNDMDLEDEAESRPGDLHAPDPATRAAAYERLTRLHADDPSGLADRLRPGLADPDPRVRRRAVLAAATSRRVALRPLLDSLRGDPDRQVRRVVREVLRRAPPDEGPDGDGKMDDSAEDQLTTPTRAVKQAVL